MQGRRGQLSVGGRGWNETVCVDSRHHFWTWGLGGAPMCFLSFMGPRIDDQSLVHLSLSEQEKDTRRRQLRGQRCCVWTLIGRCVLNIRNSTLSRVGGSQCLVQDWGLPSASSEVRGLRSTSSGVRGLPALCQGLGGPQCPLFFICKI